MLLLICDPSKTTRTSKREGGRRRAMCSSMVDCLESRANAPRRLRDATVFSVWLGMHPMLLSLLPFPSFGPMDLWALPWPGWTLPLTHGPYPGPGGPYPWYPDPRPPALWPLDFPWTAWRIHYDLPLPPAALGVKYLMGPNMVPGPHGPYGPYPGPTPSLSFRQRTSPKPTDFSRRRIANAFVP